MLDLSLVRAGNYIRYLGNNVCDFRESVYLVILAESTYSNKNNVPESRKGVLQIVEFTFDGSPLFLDLETLDLSDWELV